MAKYTQVDQGPWFGPDKNGLTNARELRKSRLKRLPGKILETLATFPLLIPNIPQSEQSADDGDPPAHQSSH